jgi:hypothetical protein
METAMLGRDYGNAGRFCDVLLSQNEANIEALKLKARIYKSQNQLVAIEALEAINARAQQTAEAMDGLWFTYNVVPIIGLVIALVIWSFYKLNDKDVQVMADCNVGKITKEEAEKLLSKKY